MSKRTPEIRNYKFVFDFLQLRTTYPFYDKILTEYYDQIYHNPIINNEQYLTNSIHVVKYIPPFLKPKLDEKQGLKAISYFQFSGFMADLDNYNNINEYMIDKMSSKSRTKMRSYVRKLEKCFKIHYKCYFGEIPKEEYNSLFTKLHSFIISRFRQRGDTHELLDQWDFIKSSSYEMILNKRASLFVIFNEKEPIDICLNYHYGQIFHNGIRSYDINYAKFRLGYIDILKQMEWCFDHNMKIFDLGLGDMSYKRMWCNVVYDFEHQILYNRKSIYQKVIAISLTCFLKAKKYLKKKNIHKVYYKIRNLVQKQTKIETKFSEPIIEYLYLGVPPELNKTSQIDLHQESYTFLKKTFLDFQYSNLEPSEDIIVYKSNTQPNMYYIIGKKKTVQIRVL